MQNRRAMGKAGLLIVCWALSLAGMSISLAEQGFFSFFMQVCIPIALIFGYLALWRLQKAFGRRPLWILAVLFAGVVTLGASFDSVGSAALVTGQKWKALLYFGGRVPAFYMGMVLLWEAMKNHKPYLKSHSVWVYAAIILACWLPYLFAVWPGTVSNDSITQLMEIFGLKTLSNGNPLLQTGLLGLFVLVGQGIFGSANAAVALYCLTQGLLMAWLLGYTVSQTAKNAPAWLTLLNLLFYALCPIFPLFAWCVGKDTSFAMAVLWLMLMVWRVMRQEKATRRDTVLLAASAVLCVLLRNAGAALAAVTLVAVLLWSLLKHNKLWRSTLYALAGVAAVLVVWHAAVIPLLSAEQSPETEILSAPLQQVARVAANEALPDDVYDDINAVLPVDKLKAAYNGELSDPVKDLWRENVTAQQKRAFFKAWFRLGLEQPSTYLSAFFHNSYGYLMPGFVSTIKPTFLIGAEDDIAKLEGNFTFSVNPHAAGMEAALKRLLTYAPFRILCAPGLYGWITLFAFAAVLMTRRRRAVLCMLPALLTLAGCLLSPVNGYFRYAMPLYVSAPLLLSLAASAIGKSEPIAL